MHNFEYKENAKKLLTPEIVNLLSSIYEHKGRQQLFVEAKKDLTLPFRGSSNQRIIDIKKSLESKKVVEFSL